MKGWVGYARDQILAKGGRWPKPYPRGLVSGRKSRGVGVRVRVREECV